MTVLEQEEPLVCLQPFPVFLLPTLSLPYTFLYHALSPAVLMLFVKDKGIVEINDPFCVQNFTDLIGE